MKQTEVSPELKFSQPQDASQYHADRDELPTTAGGGSRDHAALDSAALADVSDDEDEESDDADVDGEIRNDIISEQSFISEQSKAQAQSSRQFKAADAIMDREFEDREPLQTAVGLDDLDSAVSPQADSRGDSEEDATTEYMMGVNFRPESEDAFEEEDEDDDVENFEKDDHTNYSEQRSAAASEVPSADLGRDDIDASLGKNSGVVSTDRPSPRSDANSNTSTH